MVSESIMVNWMAKVFMDARKAGGYVVAELERRLPNQECFIGLVTSSFASTINRTQSDSQEMTNTIMDLYKRINKGTDAELSYIEGDTATYGAKIPAMPGRDLVFLFLQGPSDKVVEDMEMVRKVFAEIERRVHDETAQSEKDGEAEEGGISGDGGSDT